jgi:hypothetical protein
LISFNFPITPVRTRARPNLLPLGASSFYYPLLYFYRKFIILLFSCHQLWDCSPHSSSFSRNSHAIIIFFHRVFRSFTCWSLVISDHQPRRSELTQADVSLPGRLQRHYIPSISAAQRGDLESSHSFSPRLRCVEVILEVVHLVCPLHCKTLLHVCRVSGTLQRNPRMMQRALLGHGALAQPTQSTAGCGISDLHAGPRRLYAVPVSTPAYLGCLSFPSGKRAAEYLSSPVMVTFLFKNPWDMSCEDRS